MRRKNEMEDSTATEAAELLAMPVWKAVMLKKDLRTLFTKERVQRMHEEARILAYFLALESSNGKKWIRKGGPAKSKSAFGPLQITERLWSDIERMQKPHRMTWSLPDWKDIPSLTMEEYVECMLHVFSVFLKEYTAQQGPRLVSEAKGSIYLLMHVYLAWNRGLTAARSMDLAVFRNIWNQREHMIGEEFAAEVVEMAAGRYKTRIVSSLEYQKRMARRGSLNQLFTYEKSYRQSHQTLPTPTTRTRPGICRMEEPQDVVSFVNSGVLDDFNS